MIESKKLKDDFKMSDSLNNHIILERLKAGPSKTKITIIDHNTGEILGEYHNKILIPGSQTTACRQFGISPVVLPPTYNTELELEHSKAPYDNIQPSNSPIVCLWCAGRSGAGSSPNEVLSVLATDRISPVDDIIPFRYVDSTNDINADLRSMYYGRKVDTEKNKIAYYFKAFETEPQLHVRYLDGTQVTSNLYNIDSSQQAEVYVETKLLVTRLDFRDYFDKVLGWDKADISCISLITAWYDDTICENPGELDESKKIYYRWYQDIIPFSKLNFKAESLADLTRAIEFDYQIYY